MTCSHCGRPVDPLARACARCGAPVRDRAVEPTPTQPTPVQPTPVRPTAATPDPLRTGSDPLLAQRLSRPTRRSREPRRAGALPIVVLSLLVLVALAVAGWVLITHDSGPPSRQAAPPLPAPSSTARPTPSAAAGPTPSVSPSDGAAVVQARGLDALVDRSSQSRGAVGPAATALGACTTTPAAALAVFEQAAAGRRALLTELGALPLDAVPEAPDLRNGFTAVLQTSAAADDAFAAWARAQGGTCTPDPGNPDLARGLQLSSDNARPAKDAFVAQWNPVAARYGLPARTATSL